MANAQQKAKEVLTYLDALMTISEQGLTLNMGVLSDLLDKYNPLNFLIEVIRKMASKEELIDQLSRMIIYILPAIELGVKGVLLTNLKTLIDCNNDPFIPDSMRLKPFTKEYEEGDDENGVKVNLKNIDYKNILTVSPLSEEGRNFYSGTRSHYEIVSSNPTLNGAKFIKYKDARNFAKTYMLTSDCIQDKSEVNNVYQLARANDFNAFLWFVTHKAFYTPKTPKETLTTVSAQKISGEGISPYSVGDTIQKGSKGLISLCINSKTEAKEQPQKVSSKKENYFYENEANEEVATQKYEAEFVPVSQEYCGANWYVNSKHYFDFLMPNKINIPREYEEEYPLCHVKYGNNVGGYSNNNTANKNYVRVRVAPKPFTHVPILRQAPWQMMRFLFDAQGNPNKKGRFSIYPLGEKWYDKPRKTMVYPLHRDNAMGSAIEVNMEMNSYSLQLKEGDSFADFLYECYPGLTLYEFNYDFVMSMRLFDAETIVRSLMDSVLNCLGGANVGLSNLKVNKTETAYQMRFAKLVDNVINSSYNKATDCVFSFSNTDWEEMERESEIKRSQGYVFNDSQIKLTTPNYEDVFNTLGEFSNNSTREENYEVINRTLHQLTAQVTEEVLPEDKYNIECDIILNMIYQLVNVTISAILSPKILLLIEVNKRLMGEHEILGEDLSLDALLDAVMGMLISIIKEIFEIITKEILDWALKLLQAALGSILELIANEQVMFYARIIASLI